MHPKTKDTSAKNPETAQGIKYGCVRTYSMRPNVSGQLSAALDRTPPMMGLQTMYMSTDIESHSPVHTYPSVIPEPHINGMYAKASPLFVESVI